jgi:outer membrane immunogenic protein
MNKKFLSSTAIVLSLFAGSALAADLPSRKGPPPAYIPPPPMMSWTGFYVGVNAGYTWGESNSTYISSIPVFVNPALSAFGISEFNNITAGGNGLLGSEHNGFIGGGQVGYNWQFASAWVAGLETDIQGVAGGSSGTSAVSILPTTIAGVNSVSVLSTRKSIDYLGTVRGRIGYLFTPTLLVYGTGGLAYGGVKSSVSILQQADVPIQDNGAFASGGFFSDTRVGWTAGAGVEWMFAPNWSAKAEYLYYDLGRVTYGAGIRAATLTNGVTPIWTHVSSASTRFDGHIIRAGLNYHFNWGAAPVVAKY